jgi:hypothetical protein
MKYTSVLGVLLASLILTTFVHSKRIETPKMQSFSDFVVTNHDGLPPNADYSKLSSIAAQNSQKYLELVKVLLNSKHPNSQAQTNKFNAAIQTSVMPAPKSNTPAQKVEIKPIKNEPAKLTTVPQADGKGVLAGANSKKPAAKHKGKKAKKSKKPRCICMKSAKLDKKGVLVGADSKKPSHKIDAKPAHKPHAKPAHKHANPAHKPHAKPTNNAPAKPTSSPPSDKKGVLAGTDPKKPAHKPHVNPAHKPHAKPTNNAPAKPTSSPPSDKKGVLAGTDPKKPAHKPHAKPAHKPHVKPAHKPHVKPAHKPHAKPAHKPAKPTSSPPSDKKGVLTGADSNKPAHKIVTNPAPTEQAKPVNNAPAKPTSSPPSEQQRCILYLPGSQALAAKPQTKHLDVHNGRAI